MAQSGVNKTDSTVGGDVTRDAPHTPFFSAVLSQHAFFLGERNDFFEVLTVVPIVSYRMRFTNPIATVRMSSRNPMVSGVGISGMTVVPMIVIVWVL